MTVGETVGYTASFYPRWRRDLEQLYLGRFELSRDRSIKALSLGMRGLTVRLARGLNRIWGRVGRVLADRYHSRVLRTPREVRNALVYVLQNARKHGAWSVRGAPDPFSSGRAFGGWKERPVIIPRPEDAPSFLAQARTWLLGRGWRRHGLLSLHEVPRT